MRNTLLSTTMIVALAVSAPALAKSGGISAAVEACSATTFSGLAASKCVGSFEGNINGKASELSFLQSSWGETFTFLGKSDDKSFGPFTGNPNKQNSNVTLSFDQAISGTFVIGLKASNRYSYYLFNATSPVTSLTFSSTAGIAVNDKGKLQDLSHAALYVAAVPEPETYAMLLAGLGLMAGVARRRRPQ